MKRKTTTSDRLGARMARLGGVMLSQEDYELVDDQPDGDTEDYDPARALRQLLPVLGVEVANPTDAELIVMTARKTAELRSGRNEKGAGGRKHTNPLIPDGLDGAKIQPIAMSHDGPPALSADDEARIVEDFARRMGAEPGSALNDDMDDFSRLCSQYGR